MERKRLLLGLLLCGAILLALGCTTRSGGGTSDTPPSLLVPTAPPTQQPTSAQGGGGTVPDFAQKPEMTVLGTLESGIPFGVTEDGHSFKGDPEAPVLMIEFSEYQ
jgi:hypothetical protein